METIIIMDWICMALYKTPKAPDRVPVIHSVILVVVNCDSIHSCPGGLTEARLLFSSSPQKSDIM